MKPIYLFHGEESYYIDLYSKIIEDHVLSDGEKAFNQTIMYGKDSKVSQIVDEAMQFPMMSSHRLIILKEAQDLKNIGDLNSYVENPNPQSILVLCHKNKKIDKRLKLVKNIEKQGIVFESKKLYDNELPKWVVNYTQLHQVNIENEAALMVAELLGNDLNKIANEMDKVFIG
ncbi:MAG: DNA polymerase III subunit delta, partial [Saprospiraceae bacterium]|nr:DNA polymerase III subunit delta [Saprospiraceae bacterium]